ncbi:biotin-dependent carboxyltransferase family protein [Actinoplanes friuliensis]|uniref:Urea amidolyase n=1 Tax=Actinoplanes friuliensis DSM 7358 TaxID=1246995 RepID=U5WB73_9ACTN|nr:biotin-dependent carboxyltransferase family protein [Actinoplanes friuliensis]AGZ45225.1 urea amidolyase [Actinoplanes friuliensis DSM 7358]
MTVTIIRPGPLTVLKDEGRPGHAAQGVAPSGAVDRTAYARANTLVGNPPGLAALECTLGGLRVRFDEPATVVLTGTDAVLSVDGARAGAEEVLTVPAGAVVSVTMPRRGLRSYLAVRGGFAVEPVLGSRSTDQLAGVGPAKPAAGDTLPIGPTPAFATTFADPTLTDPAPTDAASISPGAAGATRISSAEPASDNPRPAAPATQTGGHTGPADVSTQPPTNASGRPNILEVGHRPTDPAPQTGNHNHPADPAAQSGLGDSAAQPPTTAGPSDQLGRASDGAGSEGALEVDLGPRDDWFTGEAVETFLSAEFTVSPASDAVGLRLTGPALTRSRSAELPSEGVVRGSVQVPPDGHPIIFQADHPVTGGYPVIAVLTPEAADRAAQARPGAKVRFRVAPD